MKKIFEEQKQLESPKAKYGDILHRVGHLLYIFENKINNQISKNPKEEPKKAETVNPKEEPKKNQPTTTPAKVEKPEGSVQKTSVGTQQTKPQETQNKAPETQTVVKPNETTQ